MKVISKLVQGSTEQLTRKIKVAAAQLGPVHRDSLRCEAEARMLALMQLAYAQGVQVILFPGLAFTTFFPRHYIENLQELEMYFERDIEGDPTQAPGMKRIFDQAREYAMDISIGYAECDTSSSRPEHKHYNTAVYVSAVTNAVISRYRKVHIPGTFEPNMGDEATNQLEKRYFLPGNLGFQAFRAPGLVSGALTKQQGGEANEADTIGKGDPILGTMICNDRRWPEAWRSYGLQGVELVLCGYTSTAWPPELRGTNPRIKMREDAKNEALFHSRWSVQRGSYTNACWSINVAKCGMEDRKCPLIGGSCIIDPDGQIVAEAITEDDELVVHEIDLELCRRGKEKTFAFEKHRRVEHYARIVAQTGVIEPDFL